MQHMAERLLSRYLWAMADYFSHRSAPYPPVRMNDVTSTEMMRGKQMVTQGSWRSGIPACTTCHGDTLQGSPPGTPPLAGNPMVVANDPANAIKMVLQCGFKTATESEPMPYSMPPFAHQISIRKIAAVVSHIRSAWGNNASTVVPQQVRTQAQ